MANGDHQLTILTGDQLQVRRADNATRPDLVQRYVQDRARAGQLLATAGVVEHAVEVDGSVEGVIVASEATTIDRVAVAEGQYDGASAEAHGIALGESGRGASSQAALGFGFGGGFNPQNMYMYSSDAADGWWTPNYSSDEDAHSYSAFEKWARSGGVEWIYNRYGWFHRADPNSGWAGTIDFTLRSRPWSGNEDAFANQTSHTPAPTGSSCSDSMNVTLQAGPFASLDIPLRRCSNIDSLARADTKSGGMDWDGSGSTGDVYLDYGIAQNAVNTTVVPVWADYTWASTCWATTSLSCNPLGNPQHRFNYLKTDAGW
jgi:hypothetical protein